MKLSIREEGEANCYSIVVGDELGIHGWVVTMRFNGELSVEQQRAHLEAFILVSNDILKTDE